MSLPAVQAYQKSYRGLEENRLRKCVSSARFRAKKLSQDFDLTVSYMESIWPQDGRDFYGRQLVWKGADDGDTTPLLSSPSIDKIEPSRGYVKGNVMWLTVQSNQLKGGESIADKRKLLNAIDNGLLVTL